jgi:hypothetical protein
VRVRTAQKTSVSAAPLRTRRDSLGGDQRVLSGGGAGRFHPDAEQSRRSGVVGAVGMLLGEAKINIAGLQLGRKRSAVWRSSLVHVDERIPPTSWSACASFPTSSQPI